MISVLMLFPVRDDNFGLNLTLPLNGSLLHSHENSPTGVKASYGEVMKGACSELDGSNFDGNLNSSSSGIRFGDGRAFGREHRISQEEIKKN